MRELRAKRLDTEAPSPPTIKNSCMVGSCNMMLTSYCIPVANGQLGRVFIIMDGEGVSLCPGCAGLAVIVVERPAECGRAVQKEHEDSHTTISEEQGREPPEVVETLPGPRGTQFLGCRHCRRPRRQRLSSSTFFIRLISSTVPSGLISSELISSTVSSELISSELISSELISSTCSS